MREHLKKICDVRTRFEGTFVRFGQKTSFKGPPKVTVLLKDVRRIGDPEPCADHVWMNLTKDMEKLDLKEGNKVRFDARVTMYVKGYKGHRRSDEELAPIEYDYRLSRPTNLTKVVTTVRYRKEWWF